MFVFCWFAFGVSKKIIFYGEESVFINLYFSYSVEDSDVSKKYFVKCQVERINYFAVLVIKYTFEMHFKILTGTFWYKETFVSIETNSFPGGSKSRFSFGKILFRA